MKRKSTATIILLAIALTLPCMVHAQSANDNGEVSLGDFARSQRMSKQAAAQPEINNDNFSELMMAAEQNKPWDGFKYSINSAGNSFEVSSPDVTCNLSFNSPATALLADPFSTRSLPDTEIAKLNGPAKIDGDTFEISVYNGSDWTLREVTVALTIVHPAGKTAEYGAGRLINASVTATENEQKLSDTTLLFHIKGSAAVAATGVFQKTLPSQLAPGDDWHWAIVDARGMPPKPDVALPLSLDPALSLQTPSSQTTPSEMTPVQSPQIQLPAQPPAQQTAPPSQRSPFSKPSNPTPAQSSSTSMPLR